MSDVDRHFPKIRKLFYGDSGIDLCSIVHEKFRFDSKNPEEIKELKNWIKAHSDRYKMEKVILYHGTASYHDIEDEGIKKTTAKTKRSLQSESGYVYLSIYPEMAKLFAEMGYPAQPVSIYAVEVPLIHLLPDHDQLKNKRMWSEDPNIGKTLADSLVYGSGARLKRNVEPYEVRDVTHLFSAKKAEKHQEGIDDTFIEKDDAEQSNNINDSSSFNY